MRRVAISLIIAIIVGAISTWVSYVIFIEDMDPKYYPPGELRFRWILNVLTITLPFSLIAGVVAYELLARASAKKSDDDGTV